MINSEALRIGRLLLKRDGLFLDAEQGHLCEDAEYIVPCAAVTRQFCNKCRDITGGSPTLGHAIVHPPKGPSSVRLIGIYVSAR